ncbi:hypothetical protein ACFL33_02870 [Pseudomonadota bacterium]
MALLLAAASIWWLLSNYEEATRQHVSDLSSSANADIVFIGSSLTATALPSTESVGGVLGQGRSCAMLAVPAISERNSNRLLANAIDGGALIIFVEINAYAHDHADLIEPLALRAMVDGLSGAGYRLAMSAKEALKISPLPKFDTKCAAPSTTLNLDTERLAPSAFYGFQEIEPSYPDELERLLARAREAGAEVMFISPPRPQSLVNELGEEEFAALLAHIRHLAEEYGVPVWYSPQPWPDDHFMDILAHTNELGRARFQRELAEWYEARQ